MVQLPQRPAGQPKKFGSYTTIREIARGGQGAVMEATSDVSGERVALKVLIHPSATSRKRFAQEAQVLLRLNHPNLIRIRDLGERNGFPFLAMEFIQGEDLQAIVARGLPDPEWSAKVMAPIADALQYCHEQGIVHRDLKPGNVLIELGTNRPVLVDFGLVKRDAEAMRLSAIDDASQFSRTGELRGTPCFMAPEQAHPAQFPPVSPRTDVYALGATLYHLLTGETPVEDGPMASVLYHVVATKPIDPRKHNPEVPAWLAKLTLRCLEKQPEDRPQTAAEVAAALRAGDPRAGAPAGAPVRLPVAGLMLVTGMALGLGGGVPLGLALAPDPPPAAPPVVVTTTVTPSPLPEAEAAPPPAPQTPVKELFAQSATEMKARRYERAIALCNQITDREEYGSPLWLRARRRRGWIHYLRANYRQALADHDEVVKADPRDVAAIHDRARCKAKLGDNAGALKDFDEVVSLRPLHAPYWRTRAKHRRNLLLDFKGAERDLSKAIDLAPGGADYWADRGFVRRCLGRYPEALVDYDQAAILEPTQAWIRLGRSVVYRCLGDHERALKDIAYVFEKLKQPSAGAYQHRALVRLEQKQLDAALVDVEKGVELAPKSATSFRYRGDVRLARGELEEALKDYAKALELHTGYAAVIAARGLIRLRQGHQLLGLKDLERGCEKLPRWEWNYQQLQDALAELKKRRGG